MNTKRLGIILLVLSVLLGAIVLFVIFQLQSSLVTYSCLPTSECKQVSSQLGISHIAVGLLVSLLSFAFYMIFFNKDARSVETLLKQHNEKLLTEEKFSILLKALDLYEKKIMQIIHKEREVEQNTLRLKANISKSKVSQVVTNLEKKGLISREKKKKTYLIREQIDF